MHPCRALATYAPLALLLTSLSASQAAAMSFGFGCLTNNDPGDCAIGEAQISVDVTDEGGGVVRFLFTNAGPAASSLSEIYFDDGALMALTSVLDGPSVNFEQDASPPDLPGGQNAVPPFEVSEGFLAQSLPSVSMNGVGPGEWVAIDFTLMGGDTYADVLSQLDTGELRIGIHVIAYGSGGSESFINTPEPATGTLLLLGLVGCCAARRR